jgi:tetratricopeptide (TPR) repeat protein
MGIRRLFLLVAFISTGVFAVTFNEISQTQNRSETQSAASEDAYRANNVGVALLEQFKYKEAAAEFRRALKLYPSLRLARVNLAIALYNVPDIDGALAEAKAVEATNTPQVFYLLGLIARGQNRVADAIAAFKRVLDIDARDPGANINIGQLYVQQRNYADGIAAFRTALDSENYNVTAVYNLGIALTRSGQREEGARVMQQFQKLREAGYGTTLGQSYLEQGRYAEAISSTGIEAGLVQTAMPEVTFTDATASMFGSQSKAGTANAEFFGRRINGAQWNDATLRDLVASIGGGATLFDYDGDGDLDLLDVGTSAQRLYRNDGGKFVDVTAGSGLASVPAATGINAVAGDYDNDGKPDLFVLRYNGSALYHNDGNGKFSDVTAAADIPPYPYLALSAALVDVDHDGDLDLFIAGFADLSKAPAGGSLTFPDDFAGASNRLLRNNGNGKFTEITAQAKVAGANGHAVAIVPTDYDNHRDIDLLVVNYNEAPVLFSNLRDGTFRNIAQEVGLNAKERFTCVAAGDANKDDYTDFYFGNAGGAGVFAMSDGRGRFTLSPAPAGTESVNAAQFLDYDNDGLLDLMIFSNTGARVFRNLASRWENTTDRAVAGELRSAARAFASADIDGDGDTDMVVHSSTGELKAARNDGGTRNRSLRVQLAGRVSNRSAVGAKIEARAGSLKQKLETCAASPAPAPADIVFGLGTRAAVDAVRVLWPAGIVQSETEIARPNDKKLAQTVTVTELDRKPSSCPYLYTWNGERFEFVTDFMGGGEMGYWEAPGKRNHPDPDEYVRIRGDQLKERQGRYELRVTNELEEVLYVDRLQLVAVAHPSETEVYPNEGMIDPPLPPFKLYATRTARAPLAATDDHGHDVLSRIAKLDRQFADDFTLHRIRGYSEEHTLTLDLGGPNKGRTLLLLTGWTDYAFSSDNVAAHQSGLEMMPPALQVKDAQGRWQTIISNIGIPVGRPQTVTVDLTGKFLSESRAVRIVTNMRIYWDQILVDDSAGNVSTRMTRLDPVVADLHWRGFSAEVTPDGREPFGYDYARVSSQSPWKTAPGRYTREGDVMQLLRRADDLFVVSRPGDEIVLSFDAGKLPPLPAGWKHTFLLYADGFSKEMDINSASPDAVMPLPFHGMKSYPYARNESYPMTKARREYIDRYNTRIVAAPVQKIDAIFTETRSQGPEVRGQKHIR